VQNIFPTCQPFCELQSLEARRLLAAHVSLDADNGVLNVVGDASNDQIEVHVQPRTDSLSIGREMMITVNDHGHQIYSEIFREGALSQIRVFGDYGDDSIMLTNDDGRVDTFISGDQGNDTIDAFISRSATPSRILAGEGDDLVNLSAGKQAQDGYVVLGEGGNDTINGSAMNDILYGDNESNGPASIPGDDVIRGGAGDDTIYAGDGVDVVDGGAGNDVAFVDPFDKVVNVEKVVS